MSDISGVVKLLQLVFKRPFSAEWWNWKYRLNPAGFWGEKGDIWIAENANKEIVGHWAVIPEKIKFGSTTITIAQEVNAATHPGYRRLGINKTLVRNVCSDIQNRYNFIFSFPREILYKPRLRQGWKDYRIVQFVKFLNYDQPLRRFSSNDFIIWSGKTYLKMLSTLKHLSPSALLKKYAGSPIEIQEVEQFPVEIDEFWNLARAENEFVLERTATFLNWRFSKHLGNYQKYIGRSIRDGSILGYLVLEKREMLKKQNVLDIVDLYALRSEEKLLSNFVDMAVKIAENEELEQVWCWVPPWHRYATILSKKGFISPHRLFRLLKKYQPRVIFYQLSRKGTIPKKQKWYYTLADTL